MATSLSAQLKQLAVPQTQALLGTDTQKGSFLYDPSEAAGLDRETFYYLGVNGLEELSVVDEAFRRYLSSLFSSSALYFERSIQTVEVNQELDNTISTFLLRLSPYLRLTCAQNALEWMVQKYRIHLNNTDALMECFLPYHETDMFVKILHLINLKSEKNKKWSWLLPVQKNRVHLTRQTLVNHCQRDPAFLSVIMDMMRRFVSVYEQHRNRDSCLQAVVNFYAFSLLAVVKTKMTERLLSAILPGLSRGLKSEVKDCRAASLVILSSMLIESTMQTGFLETMMNAVCKNLGTSLTREGVTVLVIIFQSQEIEDIPKKSFKRLSRQLSLPSILAELSGKFEVGKFVSAIFRRLIPAAVKQTTVDAMTTSGSSEDEAESLPRPSPLRLLQDILAGVTLDTTSTTLAARLFLESFVSHCDGDLDREVVDSVKQVVRIFEMRYPEALDMAVDSVMSALGEESERKVVREFLNLAVSSVDHRLVPNSQTTLALSLHHPRASVRLNAVTFLMDNLDTIDDKNSVKESFLARLQDDNAGVVDVLLKNPQKLWSVFTDQSELSSALVARLKATDNSADKVDRVREVMEVLNHGPSSPALEAVAVSCLLLCSPQGSVLELALHTLSSPLAAGSCLLSALKKAWLPKVKKQKVKAGESISENDMRSLNTALVESLAVAVAQQESPVQELEKLYGEMSSLSPLRQKHLACVLLEVAVRVDHSTRDPDVSAKLKLLLSTFLHGFLHEKKLLSQRWTKSDLPQSDLISEATTQLCKGRHLPATWWNDLLTRWIASLVVPGQLKDTEFWHEVSCDSAAGVWLRAVVRITDVLLHLKTDVGDAVVNLMAGLQKVFGSAEVYLRYLSVLWSGENSKSLGVTDALRDKSLQLTKTYLSDMSSDDAMGILQSSAPVVPCMLGLCGSDIDSVRSTALGLVVLLANKSGSKSTLLYRPVVDLLIHYREEIAADTAYLATALAGLTAKSSRRKNKQTDALSTLLTVAESSLTPPFLASALLGAVSGIDSMETLTPLLPLLARLLERDSLNEGQGEVMRLLLARYTDTVAAELTQDQPSLQLLTAAIRKPLTTEAGVSVPQMAIQQISKKFFAALSSLESKRSVAGALLDVLQSTTDTDIASLIRKVFKRVALPADLLSQELAPVLQSAASTVREVKRMRRETTEDKSTFGSPAWIRTTVLLEIIQNKKKIPNSSKLVPFCFHILAKVLEVEDAGEGEYLKQLILGVIHNLCKKHSSESELIEGKDLNLESIVQCIRTSSSPQTHQHALFVLSVAAHIAPEQLLHSMMSVFTFMGASILRQDDSYSFQVITRILETVFPALVMACSEHKQHRVEDMVTMILRVFVDTYPHIPEHRKLMVFTTLLRVVGVDAYLWRLILVFVEGVATRKKPVVGEESSPASAPPEQEGKAKSIDQLHVDFLISLVLEFSPLSCVQMVHQVLQYLAKLPDEKSGNGKQKQRRQSVSVLDASKEECEIFSLAYHTTKQLHKFKHATMHVLHQLLASKTFIALMSDQLDEPMVQLLKDVLEALLGYMAHTSQALESWAASPHAIYWRGLLVKCYMLLDSLLSLLPQDQFLTVVRELMDSSLLSVQRKAMELLGSRLRHLKDSALSPQQKSVLLDLVPKLQKLVGHLRVGGSGAQWEAAEFNGKLALYTLMPMARVIGMEYHVTFVEVLKQVCQVMSDDQVSGDTAATAMTCGAELISNLRAHAITHLPLVIPTILRQLATVTSVEGEMLSCCVTSLHKIMDTLPHFLTPYVQDILTQVCYIQTLLDEAPPNEQREHTMKSLKQTSKSIAALSPRVFLPTLESCYTILLESGKQECVTSMLSVLSQHLSGLSREDLHLNHHQLMDFFLVALDFRDTQRKEVSHEIIDKTEEAIIDTIVAMVMKMTEGTLRPMLLKVFEWATKEGKRDRVISFYRLADSLAGRLRGIFLLFAAHIFKHAAQLLDLLHADKAEASYLKKDKKGRKASLLLGSVLGCLQKVCLFDTHNFINKERFTLLLQPLIDQLENFVGGEDLYAERVKNSLVSTIADFAAATKNDSLWQTLNYQLMLKTRSKSKEVRLSALHALKGLHRKLGEDYVSLMPETIPFLSELMEDDSEEVEALTKEVLQDMEETFGEPLQKYFR